MGADIASDISALPRGCRTLTFPKLLDARGTLSVVEGQRHVPFKIERVFYIYGVPQGARRGGHAHKRLQQVLVALGGKMDVVLDDGIRRVRWRLEEPNQGLYIPPMVWAEEEGFSPATVALVFASETYNEADYLRSYSAFQQSLGV